MSGKIHSIAQPRPLVITEVAPVRRESLKTGHWFLDFGRAAFGTVELEIESTLNDQLVHVHFGERLAGANTVDRQPPGYVRYRCAELRVYTGRRRYRVNVPPDDRNAGGSAIRMPAELFEVLPFRYAEVTGGLGVQLHEARQLAVHYPFDDNAAMFSCSDERLNRVWELCKYSIKATSFAGVYVDGDRERIPYEGDAYINQLCHYGVDRDYEMARHSLEYMIFHPTWPTEWCLHFVPMAWADFMYTGDSSFLAAYYDELRHKVLLLLAREDGLISTTTGLVTKELLAAIHLKKDLRDLVDWPPGSFTQGGVGERDNYEMLPINTVVNAFHYWNLILFSRIAGVLRKGDDERFFAERAKLVERSIQQKLFNGIFVDGEDSTHSSLHANCFPVAMGLAPKDSRVADFIVSRGMACSVYGAQYLLDALYRLGRPQAALDLMTAEHDRGWLNMLAVGSTVTLEAWDWKYKNNLDWNHAWGAVPANIIPRRLVGVRPLKPGFAETLLAPQPAGLAWFNATVPTRTGAVVVQYERGRLQFECDGPLVVDFGGKRLNIDKPGRHDVVINE